MKEKLASRNLNQIDGEIGISKSIILIDRAPVKLHDLRYKDIVPYDYNRVPVTPGYKIAGDTEASDYINASFVSDVFTESPRVYIAAQGPGPDTTPAFWSLVWQYRVSLVVMLTSCVETSDSGMGGMVKCSQYWPDNVGDIRKFGDIQVQLFDRAEVSTFIVTICH